MRTVPVDGRKLLDVVPPGIVQRWFKDALPPKCKTVPSIDACIEISNKLRRLVNQVENAGLAIEDQRDADLNAIIAERFRAVLEARNHLLVTLEEYFEYSPRHTLGDAFGFVQLADLLAEHGTAGVHRTPAAPPRGQPPAVWHAFGRAFADWVSEALKTAGYQGNLEKIDPNSPVAHIGASMVNHVVVPWRRNKQEIGADTFASAMTGKRKSRTKNPDKALFSF